MLEIRLSNVTKSYPKKGTKEKTEVLHGINAAFCGGKLYVIKGISGSGKTTLLNLIGGIDRKYEGEISYSEAGLKKASYVFQESLLLTGLTVRENLDLIFPGSSKIDPLAEKLGVKDLLSRKTEELSGGERQRIAVLRALLQGASLILADEPTASLDGANSRRVAELFDSLKAQERIILVATHEHYFDEIADVILYIKNGTIDRIEEKDGEISSEGASAKTAKYRSFSPIKILSGIARNYSYVWKRRRKSFSLGAALPIALSLALLLVVSSIQKNLLNELVWEYKSIYPMDMLEVRMDKLEELLTQPGVTPYYDYRIKGDTLGSYTYSLLPEEYSCFSLPGVIEYGSFPKEADEVIVTSELAEKLGATDPKAFIGTEITFCGEQFRVSGITGGPENRYRTNGIHRETVYREAVMVPEAAFALYDTVKEKGEIWKGESFYYVRCVWPGLSDSEEKQEYVRKLNSMEHSLGSVSGNISQYYNDLDDLQDNADLYSYFFYIVLILIFLSTGVFLCSLIHVDLFYRRRELGYLQIFGMKKGRVTKMLLREYLMKYLLSFALSFVIFGIALVIAAIWRGRFLFPDWKVCMIMEGVLLVIHMGSVFIGIITFLVKSPAELIGRN